MIRARLKGIFVAYQRGEDVPPALRFRAEGFIEAYCELGLISIDEAFELMAQEYKQVFNQSFPFSKEPALTIPVLMKRAPVYPST